MILKHRTISSYCCLIKFLIDYWINLKILSINGMLMRLKLLRRIITSSWQQLFTQQLQLRPAEKKNRLQLHWHLYMLEQEVEEELQVPVMDLLVDLHHLQIIHF